MNAAELKLMIFRQVDTLDNSSLEDIYGLLSNYINGQKDTSDWKLLSETQKKGIYKAIDELDEGQHILNEDIIKKYKKLHADE
ncbi:hypothetical protein [Labilibacter marinus]|uniref:hypothetical protein n=1 Tax=Labilibacter marinus TaxID=1477105 RepID=UPI000950078B|nr:hypothetical protein [Labilibacter marinus]